MPLSLYHSSLEIIAYSDAAYVKNANVSSKPGRIVLLSDGDHSYVPVSYMSYILRLVACSVLSAEVIAFADLFDYAFAIHKQLELRSNQLRPVHMLTDMKSLFDKISKGSRTSEYVLC